MEKTPTNLQIVQPHLAATALEIFVAFPDRGVYTGADESHSSLKGIVRSRNLPMEVKVSRREQPYQAHLTSPSPFFQES